MKGTGLGLPLSKRLAELLGGSLSVTSEPGIGSRFTATVPVRYKYVDAVLQPPVNWQLDKGRLAVLVIEDTADAQFMYERLFRGTRFQPYPTASIERAQGAFARIPFSAIVLDIERPSGASWDDLTFLKRNERTRGIPVVVISSLDEREKALALGAEAYVVKPIDRRLLLDALQQSIDAAHAPVRVLVVDDQEISRFVMRECLPAPAYQVREAHTGEEALQIAPEFHPDIVLLDLMLPGMPGADVLTRLKADAKTRDVPVVVVTSTILDADGRGRLAGAAAILSKSNLSRDTLERAVTSALPL